MEIKAMVLKFSREIKTNSSLQKKESQKRRKKSSQQRRSLCKI